MGMDTYSTKVVFYISFLKSLYYITTQTKKKRRKVVSVFGRPNLNPS